MLFLIGLGQEVSSPLSEFGHEVQIIHCLYYIY